MKSTATHGYGGAVIQERGWSPEQRSSIARNLLPVLLPALSARAHARQRWPALGFVDEAAAILLEALGSEGQCICTDADTERRCLIRSQWFDHQCQSFFEKYPHGLCIDIGSGLNTRFHRLCSCADWPRFQWVDVDLPEVVLLKSSLIPKTDNYRMVSADIATDDWLDASGWQSGVPLIISLEGTLAGVSVAALMRLFEQIAKRCRGNEVTEVLFDYVQPAPKPLWRIKELSSRLIQWWIKPITSGALQMGASFGGIAKILDAFPEYSLVNQLELSDALDERARAHSGRYRNGPRWGCAHFSLSARIH